MTILAWIVLGLIAGWLASTLMGAGGYGLIGDIVIGVLGSIVGGWLASQLLGLDVTGLNVTSVAIAVVGAVILIFIFRAISPGRSRGPFSGAARSTGGSLRPVTGTRAATMESTGTWSGLKRQSYRIQRTSASMSGWSPALERLLANDTVGIGRARSRND